MGEGNGNGKVRVCSRRATRGAKAISLCMIQPFIISVFQNLGSACFFKSPAFFSESGGKFCRIEESATQRRIQVCTTILGPSSGLSTSLGTAPNQIILKIL